MELLKQKTLPVGMKSMLSFSPAVAGLVPSVLQHQFLPAAQPSFPASSALLSFAPPCTGDLVFLAA